jgi:hypothetical protein
MDKPVEGVLEAIVGFTRPGKRLQKTNWKDPPLVFW